MKKLLLLALLPVLLGSCSHKAEHVERAFYYWKSNDYELSAKEDTLLDTLKIQKLYLKFFEVQRDEMMGNIPVAKTDVFGYDGFKYDSIQVIPTVFITNDVFIKSSRQELDTLATNMVYLLEKHYKENVALAKPKEFQMDCDWTPKSRDNYFYFLTKFKKESGALLSCTLRLYPYKYPETMGVPPVDKVTLMCYNLVNPLESEMKNSILDTKELSLYLNKRRDYPLHTDVALPTFSWLQVYQNKRFRGLVYPEGAGIKKILKPVKPLWYEITKDTSINEHYLRVGDLVKYEEITPQKINDAIAIIKENVAFDDTITVTLFHLDENQLKSFSHETLSGFYTSFKQ
jgi:hypothetical protein